VGNRSQIDPAEAWQKLRARRPLDRIGSSWTSSLSGKSAMKRRGFTIIDITSAGSLDLSHYGGGDYTRTTNANSLPAKLTTPQGVLNRVDLANLPNINLPKAK